MTGTEGGTWQSTGGERPSRSERPVGDDVQERVHHETQREGGQPQRRREPAEPWVIYDTEGDDYDTSGSVVDLAEDDDLRYGPIDSLSRPDELIGSDVADSRGVRSSELDLDTSMNVSSDSMTIGSDDFDTLADEWRDANSGKVDYRNPSGKPDHKIFSQGLGFECFCCFGNSFVF